MKNLLSCTHQNQLTMNNKRNFADIAGAALLIISIFLKWSVLGDTGLDMIKGALKVFDFKHLWPIYCILIAVVGAALLLLGNFVSGLAGIGYFLAVSGFLAFTIKMLIDSKGNIFKASEIGFYLFLAGGILLLLRPVFKSR
jgi:hypothetical protein